LFERRGIANYREVDNDCASVVYWAIRRDNLPMLEKFLAGDKTLAFDTDFVGADCLNNAASYGSDNTIPFLFSIGFSPDGLGQHRLGFTPLIRAAWNGAATSANLLI